jgi:5-methylcytosine-specific restriction enzyme B
VARGDISREAVLEALRQFDELGEPAFYERSGYGPARDYVIRYGGAEYPSKAIYAVAYDSLHQGEPSLHGSSFRGGQGRVVPELTELGFEVAKLGDGPTENESDVTLQNLIAEWKAEQGEPWPTQEVRRNLDMRERFEAMFARDELNPESFDMPLFRQFTVRNYGGPGNQSRLLGYLKASGDAGLERLLNTFRHLLYSDDPVEQRLDDILEQPQWRVSGLGESLAVKALAVTDPTRFIPLFVFWSGGGHGKRDFMQLRALGLAPFDESGLTRGQKAVQSNDLLRAALEPHLGNDTYAMSWFLWWLHARQQTTSASGMSGTKEGLTELADRLMLPRDWLEEIIALLHDKHQVIFYGPPGTGKTYVAREIQRYLAPDPLGRKTVQFHPSYSYEDFVEGYRPAGGADGEPPTFQIQRGPLLELADQAEETGLPAVLLIDEINRGNLAKVFGELYYLLEYRDADDAIKLQYSESLVVLPESLYIIGTMNTADRSIALVDAALRRRFHFVPFYPDQAPISGLLRNWLKATNPEMDWVADLVEGANAKLDHHLQIGPSHFMRRDLDENWVRRIWKYTVLPYIEEQFFDDHEQLAAFDINRLIASSEPDEAAEHSDQEEGSPNEDGGTHGVDAPNPAPGV